MTTIGLGG